MKRRTENYDTDDTQGNGVNEDHDEDDVMTIRTTAQVTKKLTKTNKMQNDSDTENEIVDPWDKLREEVINDRPEFRLGATGGRTSTSGFANG